MKNRRKFTAEFKAKVALEALCRDRTIQEIANETNITTLPAIVHLRMVAF